MDRRPIRPERLPRVKGGFAAIPNRFLHGGFFASLGHVERSLYLFLVLAADRNGISFYGYDKICTSLGVRPDEYVVARDRLIDADLIAFEAGRYQVLSLPDRPHTPIATPPRRPRRPQPATQPRPPASLQPGLHHEDGTRLDAILRALRKR